MFVINSLDYGGAERMLVNILSTNAFADDEVFVVVLKSEGGLTARLRAAGVVLHLNITKSLDGFIKLVAPRCANTGLTLCIAGYINQTWLQDLVRLSQERRC